MDITSKKKESKFMHWFKQTIIHKNNDENNDENNINSKQNVSSTPKVTRRHSNEPKQREKEKEKEKEEKPQFKLFAKSLDGINRNFNKNVTKIRNEDNNNKCYTELNNKQYKIYWKELNEINKCDSSIMTFEANHQCLGNDKCGPCKRLHFILEYCPSPSSHPSDNDSLTAFMNGLSGYSHIQLTKDFRHLQIFHSISKETEKENNKDKTVDFGDTKSLLKHIYNSLSKYDHDTNSNKNKQSVDVLTAVSKLMMQLQTNKDFNEKYIKLRLISQGANGKIYAVKSWKKDQLYAMKEICFKNLSINILYEILRNWQMVQKEDLVGTDMEMFIDSKKSNLLIVHHLYEGSMCNLLKNIVLCKHRCLTEPELKDILKNGVLDTLKKMHCNGYIHGDIKPENIVYEIDKENANKILTAIIDYDLSIQYTLNLYILCQWRGTLGYSAPEWSPYKTRKSKITPKVDIYSLGLTMLILLCGEQPFLCPTIIQQKLQKENPNINIKEFVYETMKKDGELMISHFLKKKLSKKISDDLYQLLQSMLIFDPQKRFDIEQVINHKWFDI